MDSTNNGQQFAVPPSKYSDIVSALPVRNDWKFMPLHQYEGHWYFTIFLDSVLDAQKKFQAHSNDIIVSTYPKTGTHWLKALTFAIATRTIYPISETPLLTNSPNDLIPHIEFEANQTENYTRNPEKSSLLSTHISYNSLPSSIKTKGCKIVYLCRDPKDVLVSTWHYFRGRLPEGIDKDEFATFDDAYNAFCEGITFVGPYWDHVSGYWKAHQENPDKVLFLRYEDLKNDTVCNVKKLAEFLECPFSPEEESEGVINEIIRLCSFENMKNLKVTKEGCYGKNTAFQTKNSLIYRKGGSGDWKNYFSEELGARLDQIVEGKLSGSGYSFLSK